MTRLSVNINKIATLRNARGGNIPDVLAAALACEQYGARGITVHPRPDERHITKKDVYALKEVLTTEFNIEGYPSEDFLKLLEDIRPAQATLVPDPPDVLTSNAGWDVDKNLSFLRETVVRLQGLGIRVSLFMETDHSQIEKAGETGTDRIELYTGPYAWQFPTDKMAAVKPYQEAALTATEAGLGVNAGHDLNLKNLKWFKQYVPSLLEVSIGHALIADALYYGLENTIGLYLNELKDEA